jgi:hypothetical protein
MKKYDSEHAEQYVRRKKKHCKKERKSIYENMIFSRKYNADERSRK